MIMLNNAETFGWEAAIRGMRNPMNSWSKSDSSFKYLHEEGIALGANDLDLMKRLIRAGSDHRKFLRMIMVSVDITAPLYWWKEFDTYKVGTVANSCSTMHKVHAKKFTVDDFSHEHLNEWELVVLERVIDIMNENRDKFVRTKEKHYWWQMIQLLPSSYNQKRTVMLNYEVLRNMYHARKAHKLDEWRDGFCEWVRGLPYAQELIVGEE